MNKKIYMTYKKHVPDYVFENWKKINPEYEIDFSLDEDCINFLRDNFNSEISEKFKEIPIGMYKADLWRLCKLYVNAGVYSDVDILPNLKLDELDKSITFYSCLAIDKISIFQAFIANFSEPKNPLFLMFLISLLLNNPYDYPNGPTFDMYNCIKYNLGEMEISSEILYEINEVKIKVPIGNSEKNIKIIDLYYFPEDIEYSLQLVDNKYSDKFEFTIVKNKLKVRRLDIESGWGYPHICNICIPSKQKLYFFTEVWGGHLSSCYVTYKNNKILDSRHPEYRNW